MTDRENNLRSVLFLVIGILLLLSLIICIFIVAGESDLIKIEADVTKVKKDADGTGKNDVTLVYEVDGVPYQYNFYSKDDVSVDDKMSIFYHEKNRTSVQTFKTSKLIFICPVIGLVLCIIGLFELFKKNSNERADNFKTSVIGVVGNTQQLKVITDEAPVRSYEMTPDEQAEVQVKTIKREIEDIAPVERIKIVEEAPAVASREDSVSEEAQQIVSHTISARVQRTDDVPTKKEVKSEEPQVEREVVQPISMPLPTVPRIEERVEIPSQSVESTEVIEKSEKQNSVEDEIVKKVQSAASSSSDNKGLGEDDIKNMIKDVLKEVIQEVKDEKEPPKKVEQRRVLPNYYYISGTSLIYEEPGKEAKEISLKTIKSVVRTVNSEGAVVKLVVSNDEIKCILTNMKNIDLEQVANLLHNKMNTIDESFNEVIEHKEY